MVRFSLTHYLIAVGIFVLCFASFLGYREYQSNAEFENFMSKMLIFQQSVDNNEAEHHATDGHAGSSRSSVVKVGIAEEETEDIKVEYKPKPVFFSHEEMVKQRVQAPDGKIREIYVPKGYELKEGESVSESFFDQPPPFNFESITGGSIKKSEIPEGESIESYTTKSVLADAHGVSIKEIEKMMERGEIEIVSIDRSPVVEFDDDLPRTGSASENVPSGQDADAAPVRPDSPPVASDLPNMVKPTPSPPSMADLEKQLTPEGIETELTEGLSTNPADKAQKLIDQYGMEEGLRRLRESAPGTAERFERERLRSERPQSSEPSRNVPDGEESEQ